MGLTIIIASSATCHEQHIEQLLAIAREMPGLVFMHKPAPQTRMNQNNHQQGQRQLDGAHGAP